MAFPVMHVMIEQPELNNGWGVPLFVVMAYTANAWKHMQECDECARHPEDLLLFKCYLSEN